MFAEYRVPIPDALLNGNNVIDLLFESAFLPGRELEEQQGHKNEFWNGDSSRLNVRKIACHYGWDWVSLQGIHRMEEYLTLKAGAATDYGWTIEAHLSGRIR